MLIYIYRSLESILIGEKGVAKRRQKTTIQRKKNSILISNNIRGLKLHSHGLLPQEDIMSLV